MKLNEYLSLCLFSQIMGVLKEKRLEPTTKNVANCYDNNFFYTPRIYCKDGFNISIQINNGNYCSSENGYREFGLKWQGVEWVFPVNFYVILKDIVTKLLVQLKLLVQMFQ